MDTTTANVDDDVVMNVEELELAALDAVELAVGLVEVEDEDEGASPESSSENLPLCARMPAWLVVDIRLIW